MKKIILILITLLSTSAFSISNELKQKMTNLAVEKIHSHFNLDISETKISQPEGILTNAWRVLHEGVYEPIKTVLVNSSLSKNNLELVVFREIHMKTKEDLTINCLMQASFKTWKQQRNAEINNFLLYNCNFHNKKFLNVKALK